MLAGYNILSNIGTIERTYDGLASHDIIYLTFSYWLFEQFDNDDGVILTIDNTRSFPIFGIDCNDPALVDVCGHTEGDLGEIPITMILYHSAPSLTLHFQTVSNGNSDLEPWAINKITILMKYKYEETEGLFSAGPQTPTDFTQQNCGTFQFAVFYACVDCHSNCLRCSGAAPNECVTCKTHRWLDGTRCRDCHPTCSECIAGEIDKCYICYPGDYLYWDGTCEDNCSTILIPRTDLTTQFCDYPCLDTQYLTWYGVCIEKCESPYLQRIFKGKQFCDFPCEESGFLYWNGSCLSDCKYPLSPDIINLKNYCFLPCHPTQYLYLSTNCSNSCDPSFTMWTEGDLKHCNCPEHKIVNQLGKCSCPPGQEESSDKQNCEPTFSVGDILEATQSTAIKTVFGLSFSFILTGANPTLVWRLVNLIQKFYYLLFMNVEYPKNFESFLRIFSTIRLNAYPGLFELMGVKKSYSPSKFYKNDYSGTFFLVADPMFYLIFSSIIIYCVFKLLFPNTMIKKRVLKFYEWSGFLKLWNTVYLELMYSCLLQFGAFSFNSAMGGISSLSSVIVFLCNLGYPFLCYCIINRHKGKRSLIKYLGVVEDYDLSHPITRYHSCYILCKKMILSFGVVLAYSVPVVQNLIPLICYYVLMAVVMIYPPHLKNHLNYFDSFNDGGFIIIHSCIMILSWEVTSEEWLDNEDKEAMGVFMIAICIILIIGQIVLIVREQYYLIKGWYDRIRKKNVAPILKKNASGLNFKKESSKQSRKRITIVKEKEIKMNPPRIRTYGIQKPKK